MNLFKNIYNSYVFPTLYGGFLGKDNLPPVPKDGDAKTEVEKMTTSTITSQDFIDAINNVASFLRSIAVPLATCALIVCGIMYMVSGRKGMDNVTERLKYIVIGILVIYGASMIAGFVQGIIQ